MNWIDYVILGVIGLSALISLFRGFVREALSLVIWLAAFFIASHFYVPLSSYLTFFDDPLIRKGAAIAALFIATLIIGALVSYITTQLVNKTGLTGTDRVLGLVFGAIRGVLIVSALLFFIDAFTTLDQSRWWKDSMLIPQFGFIIHWFFEFIQNTSSFLSRT